MDKFILLTEREGSVVVVNLGHILHYRLDHQNEVRIQLSSGINIPVQENVGQIARKIKAIGGAIS